MHFLNSWVIFHCIYVPQLSYPLVCWWTSRLLPCPGYYKQCCDEHWGKRVSFILFYFILHVSFNFGFLGVYAQQWDCWVLWQFYFQFFKNLHIVLHRGCTSMHSHQECKKVPFSPHPLQHLLHNQKLIPQIFLACLPCAGHCYWPEMCKTAADFLLSESEFCWEGDGQWTIYMSKT